MLPNVDELTGKIREWALKAGIAAGEITKAAPEEMEQLTTFVVGMIPALRFVPGGRKKARGLVLEAIKKLPKSQAQETGIDHPERSNGA